MPSYWIGDVRNHKIQNGQKENNTTVPQPILIMSGKYLRVKLQVNNKIN